MARIRTIKPDFWTDEKLGKLKRDIRLLFIGLWNIADDQGVIKANASYIKGQLFSYDDELRVNTVTEWLSSLQQARMVIPFTFNGEGYYVIRTFCEHQLINRPSKPKFPEEMITGILSEQSSHTHGAFSKPSQPEGKGKEIEKEGKGSEHSPPLVLQMTFSSKLFSTQWDLWKDYRAKEHKFFYKTVQSEQAAINDLTTLSDGEEKKAIAIIHQSMAKGWKGFFELKNGNDGKQSTGNNSQPTGSQVSVTSALDKLNRFSD